MSIVLKGAFVSTLLYVTCSAASGVSCSPGLGDIMGSVQNRHIKLWSAGEQNNWELANYELNELEEAFEDAERLHPRHQGKQLSLSTLIKDWGSKPIAEVRKAIQAKSPSLFIKGYDSLTLACNHCHTEMGNGFLVIKRPKANGFADQEFKKGE